MAGRAGCSIRQPRPLKPRKLQDITLSIRSCEQEKLWTQKRPGAATPSLFLDDISTFNACEFSASFYRLSRPRGRYCLPLSALHRARRSMDESQD